jgi:hypothetical protein
LPDANRSKPAAARRPEALDDDPRTALARKYLQEAEAELAAKEAEQPRARRARAASGSNAPRAFSLSVAPATFVHIILGALALTFGALAVLLCVHMLLVNFVVGRVIALPTGVVVAAVLGYLSVLFLGIIESTSTGYTNVDSLQGDWRDWFWTLPSTLGMLGMAAFIGWIFSLVTPVSVWVLIGASALVLYPYLQLSSLETGSPLSPLSLPVLQSFVKHPAAWFVLYAVSFALVNALWVTWRWAWRDPPYVTLAIMGPIVAVALFFYAWLLGQLAHLISKETDS